MAVIGTLAGLAVGIIGGLLAYHAHIKANPAPTPEGIPFASCPRCGELLSALCAAHRAENVARMEQP